MATNTENLNLTKPTQADFYDVEVFSENFQKLDDFAGRKDNPHNVTKEQLGLSNVNNTSDADKPVSKAQAEAIADAKATGTTAQTGITSHSTNKSNPHGVTKAQVGLGNVPDVATNDQTPTYTEASTLTNLTSGEKLSVAFGKIKKAVTEIIAHISKSATSSVSGHVKITDSVTSTATDTAASAKAVKTVHDVAQNANFQLLKTISVNVSTTNDRVTPVVITGINWGEYQEICIEVNGTLKSSSTATQVSMGIGPLFKESLTAPNSAYDFCVIHGYSEDKRFSGKTFTLDAKLNYSRVKQTNLVYSPDKITTSTQYFYCQTDYNSNTKLLAKNGETISGGTTTIRDEFDNYYYTVGASSVTATLNIYGRK